MNGLISLTGRNYYLISPVGERVIGLGLNSGVELIFHGGGARLSGRFKVTVFRSLIYPFLNCQRRSRSRRFQNHPFCFLVWIRVQLCVSDNGSFFVMALKGRDP